MLENCLFLVQNESIFTYFLTAYKLTSPGSLGYHLNQSMGGKACNVRPQAQLIHCLCINNYNILFDQNMLKPEWNYVNCSKCVEYFSLLSYLSTFFTWLATWIWGLLQNGALLPKRIVVGLIQNPKKLFFISSLITMPK